MNRFLNIEKELSQDVLHKGPNAQTLYALIRLKPDDSLQNKGKIPLDLRMILDHSGSMASKASNRSNQTSLQLLKKACQRAVGELEKDDRITIYLFSDKSRVLRSPFIIKSGRDRNSVRDDIRKIDYGGSTHLSSSIKRALKVKNLNNYIQRALIFTDGEVNVPSQNSEEKNCMKLAGEAGKAGMPFQVYGTGISYNEKFLKGLAERSGGFFEHISDPADMANLFTNQLVYFKDIAITRVSATLEAVPGVMIRKVSRVIPDIHNYTCPSHDYFSTDLPDVDRVKGVALLVTMEIAPVFNVKSKVLNVRVMYDVPAAGMTALEQAVSVEVDFTDDPSLVNQNQKVLDTVTLQAAHDLTTIAAEKADTGQGDAAITLMTKAAGLYRKMGADDMATKLVTLSNSVGSQGKITGAGINTRRTLTTSSSKMITKSLTNSPSSSN